MNLNFLVNIALKYLQEHPEIVEKIVHALISELVNRLDGDPNT